MANEKRLIDANALLEDFGEEPMVWNDSEAEIQERNDWRTYTRMVKNAPTVDAVEVVHGRWIFGDVGVIGCSVECSACGWGCNPVDKRAWMRYPGHKYCGNCGAKMDGDGNGT